MDGLTGPIKFDENGKRKGIELEILNLRNNSFKKVRSKIPYWHLLFFKSLFLYWLFLWSLSDFTNKW